MVKQDRTEISNRCIWRENKEFLVEMKVSYVHFAHDAHETSHCNDLLQFLSDLQHFTFLELIESW